jgi:6,7-dimethyl-8-ribityllumazine synthase
MATSLKNLSEYNPENVPDGSPFRIGIVVSEWNDLITGRLLEGARTGLLRHGVHPENIFVEHVPGTFELPLACLRIAEKQEADAVIALGCVIRGETPHFDFICAAAAQGIMDVGLRSGKPVVFGVLTTLDNEQAQERAGGKHGNKGTEAAVTALKMIRK